ncbi:hypothetical protein HYFRA_00012503 [Hymenoscyphus fraxineus]|uniref:Extracellular serine-rich protein n=1 Tax=Hymenoscyphus fraxineus TaxID=746836 RepID=A0A9N9PVS6_9HELO|nr:hypothetical protein HYFRA_00012503 [Hymenoscyphus fraxineus]
MPFFDRNSFILFIIMSLTTSLAAAMVAPTLTTTFMPSNTACVENHLTMLENRKWEIWMNEVLPVPGTTMTDCYPTQYINSRLELAGGVTQGAFQALICPQSYSSLAAYTSNYIACCPNGYQFTPPKTTVFSDRPAFGGTCYTPITMGTPVIVTAYGSSGVTATSIFSAPDIHAAAYASPYEGFAYGVAQVPSITAAPSATTGIAAPTSTSGASGGLVGKTHTVIAGAGPTFIPSSVDAQVGDKVVFAFSSGNHTITQSSFEKPCEKLPNGFDSDYIGNSATEISLAVNVSTAQFFYSKQSSDCKDGMVFALNPTSAQSESAFRALAISQTGSTSSRMSPGVIAGIVIASIAGVGILGLLALLHIRRRKQHQPGVPEKLEDGSSRSESTYPNSGLGNSGFRNEAASNNINEAEGSWGSPKAAELYDKQLPTELAGCSAVEMSAENATHHEANMSEKDGAQDSVRDDSPTKSIGTHQTWGYEPTGNERAEIMSPESNPRYSQRPWGAGTSTTVSSPEEEETRQNLSSPNDRSLGNNGWR